MAQVAGSLIPVWEFPSFGIKPTHPDTHMGNLKPVPSLAHSELLWTFLFSFSLLLYPSPFQTNKKYNKRIFKIFHVEMEYLKKR